MVRFKNRYFVVKIREYDSSNEGPLHLHQANLYGAIIGAIKEVHGDFGAAASRAGLVTKYCNPLTRIAIVRCRHGPHKLVASSMPFVKYIGQYRAFIKTLTMGATMRHCFKFIKNYQQQKLEKYSENLKTDEEKTELKKMLMNMEPLLSIK